MKRHARAPSLLSSSLHHRLNAYALAASVAGVGVLALAQPAEARIVYTKVNFRFGFGQVYHIYFTHQGREDFGIQNRTYNSRTFILNAYAPVNNRVWVQSEKSSRRFAAALPAGVRISGSKFNTSGPLDFYMATVANSTFSGGPWKDVHNRYLGFEFRLKGKTHYGWARLSVETTKTTLDATLTGYAYETIPNKPIIAGKTHGRDGATLGRLAQGASGVSNRRKP